MKPQPNTTPDHNDGCVQLPKSKDVYSDKGCVKTPEPKQVFTANWDRLFRQKPSCVKTPSKDKVIQAATEAFKSFIGLGRK